MKRLIIYLLFLILLAACTPDSVMLQGSASGVDAANERSQTSADEGDNSLAEANNLSEKPAISDDGNLVIFVSKATNLVSGDTNTFCGLSNNENCPDIFLHNRSSGVISRISISSGGGQSDNSSDSPAISGNGRFAAFVSAAGNLVPGDTNNTPDIFVRDLQTGQTTRISVSSSGGQSNGASDQPSVSGDGRFITFLSTANNLVPNDNNGVQDIFVRDTVAGATSRVSISSTGQEANYSSLQPVISADGLNVAYISHASNLVPGDTNNTGDVFIHNRQTGTTTRISVASNGTQSNVISWAPDISSNGRYVVFSSNADNLVSADLNQWGDIFLRDITANTTTLISAAANKGQANSWSQLPVISADGSFVAFFSWASNLTSNDENWLPDIFLYQKSTGQFTLTSVAGSGVQQSIGVTDMVLDISGNGRYIVYATPINNLIANDTNGWRDVFVYDRQTTSIIRVSGN
jgi:hypothetical protein